MNSHDFDEIKTDISGTRYRKCKRCGCVNFLEGDPFFNLFCLKAKQDREGLRKKLERNS